MGYRTYVGTTDKKEIQILGNNVCYPPLIDELIRQGIDVDADGIYGSENKDNRIKDIQSIIEVLEQYIKDEEKENFEFDIDIFNLRPDEKENIDLTSKMREFQQDAYIFVSANLVNYLKDNLVIYYDIEKKKYIHKIKEGKEVWFSAY